MSAEDHKIAIECTDPRADGTPQCRWVCSCGERGIPVGCPEFPAGEWAAGAGRWHVVLAARNEAA